MKKKSSGSKKADPRKDELSRKARKTGRRAVLLFLLFFITAAAGFGGGVSWERWKRGKTTMSDGYKDTVLPGKGKGVNRRMPGDFERKTALLLPARELVEHHPKVFADVVEAVWRNIRVVCVAKKETDLAAAKRILVEKGIPRKAVSFVKVDMDTMWIRDYGPIFVKDGKGRNMIINAEYVDTDDIGERWHDDDLPIELGKWFGLQVDDLPIVIEGGNLLSNGEGLIVSTTSVEAANRHRGYDVHKLFDIFNEKLGAKQWVFLECLEGERTGHADVFISFLAPNIVLVGECDPKLDPVNAERLDRAARALARQPTSRGPMRVYRIPVLPPKDGIWRSYANSILINGLVLLPHYSDADPEIEAEVAKLYQRLLPTWKVVRINADTLVVHHGALHCISQQIPSGVSLNAILKADND